MTHQKLDDQYTGLDELPELNELIADSLEWFEEDDDFRTVEYAPATTILRDYLFVANREQDIETEVVNLGVRFYHDGTVMVFISHHHYNRVHEIDMPGIKTMGQLRLLYDLLRGEYGVGYKITLALDDDGKVSLLGASMPGPWRPVDDVTVVLGDQILPDGYMLLRRVE